MKSFVMFFDGEVKAFRRSKTELEICQKNGIVHIAEPFLPAFRGREIIAGLFLEELPAAGTGAGIAQCKILGRHRS